MTDEIEPGRPMPIGRRFPKGQSGNPGGRPKKALNLAAAVEKVSLTEQQININGKNIWVTTNEAICWTLLDLALKRDLKAIRMWCDLHRECGLLVQLISGTEPINPAEYQEILAAQQRDVLERHTRTQEHGDG
jgi:hypothetical protein